MSALNELKRKVIITKGARFNAHRRLERRHNLSAYVIAMLSVFVIAISLLPNLLRLNEAQNQVLLASSIVLSVFIIVQSLSEGSRNFFHKAELLHENGRKLVRIHNRLELLEDDDPDLIRKLEEISNDYEQVIDSCHLNHENVDRLRVIVDRPDLFPYIYPKNPIALFLKRRLLSGKGLVSEFLWCLVPACSVGIVGTLLFFVLPRFGE